MEKERYIVKVSDDLISVAVFDLQENKYVINESVILLDTAHLLCDLFNKVDKQDARIKELEEENQQLKQSQNQKPIDELENVLNNFRNRPAYFDVVRQELCLNEQDKQFIDLSIIE